MTSNLGSSSASNTAAGGGGSSGAYISDLISVIPNETLDLTIGSGGGGGNGSSAASGSNGGLSKIVRDSDATVLLSAPAGEGGSGMAPSTTGGFAIGGDSLNNGNAATVGSAQAGSSGAKGEMGIRLSGTVGASGAGGCCPFGQGAIGRTGAGIGNDAPTTNAYGGGGGGGLAIGATSRNGGSGARGAIIITPISC